MDPSSTFGKTSVLGGRVTRCRLPLLEGRPPPDAPALKRLRLPQGDLAQIHDGSEPVHYLACIELRPGTRRGNHYHLRKQERCYLVTGTARLTLEDITTHERAELSLIAGDLVAIPPGIAHAIEPLEAGQAVEFAPAPLDVGDSFSYPVLPPSPPD